MQLVNYARSEVARGQVPIDVSSKDSFADEKYLQPVLKDDAVLYSLDDLVGTEQGEDEPTDRVAELEAQLRKLESDFDNFRKVTTQALERNWETGFGTKSSSSSVEVEQSAKSSDASQQDKSYFESYSYNGTSFRAADSTAYCQTQI